MKLASIVQLEFSTRQHATTMRSSNMVTCRLKGGISASARQPVTGKMQLVWGRREI